MILIPTPLADAWIVEVERHEDARGFFARAWCRRELAERGLDTEMAQCSFSRSTRQGTLRGMHWQAPPHEEVKLVRCTRGAIWDVIIDLRPRSPTYTKHFGIELTADKLSALYVPRGFAHGFVTLQDDTDVFYQMSAFYAPEASRGLRWNDPAFAVEWPVSDPTMNDRDASYPDWAPEGEP